MKKVVIRGFDFKKENKLTVDEKRELIGGAGIQPPVIGGIGNPPEDYPYPTCLCTGGNEWATMVMGKCPCWCIQSPVCI